MNVIKQKKNKIKIFIGSVGIILTILGWLCANSSEYPFMRRVILSKYSIAISTYDKMKEKGFVLNNGEIGFTEISELIEDGIKTIMSTDNTSMLPPKWECIKNVNNLEITRIETLETKRGIGYYDKVTTFLKLRIFSNNSPPFDLPIENMQDFIEKRYNNDVVFFWGNCIFFLGVTVSLICLLAW